MISSINRNKMAGVFAGLLVAILIALGGPAGKAEAHTTVSYASANSKVLKIVFTGPIRRGSIRATNSSGKVVSKGRGGRDNRNVNGLKVRLKNVRNGSYKASWKIVAVDGHKQSGTVRFRVG